MSKARTAALLASVLLAVPAQAATTSGDLRVIARAVGFVNGLPRGAVDTVIVEGAGAEAVLAAMESGVAAGGITLNPRIVPLSQLTSSGARVIVVPEGQGAAHANIAAAARALRAVTVSTDMACVRAGHCVVGVRAAPRVEIVVSSAAASASHVSFSQAFRVMIREI